MAHSHHMHREHQVSHRRVHKILEEHGPEAKTHAKSHAFSKVTSKSAAQEHDKHAAGHKAPHRYARGGKVKGHKGHQTNIAIVMPHHPAAGASPPMAAGSPGGLPPGGPPPLPMGGPGGPPGMPPPGGPPPGMPMRKHGGRVNKDCGGATDPGPMRPTGNATYDPKTGKASGLKSGGRVGFKTGGKIDGESTKANIDKWAKRASGNSYARGGMTAGAATGVGRLEEAAHRKGK